MTYKNNISGIEKDIEEVMRDLKVTAESRNYPNHADLALFADPDSFWESTTPP